MGRQFAIVVVLVVLLSLLSAVGASAVGKYCLAYWRECGAYENQAPPAGAMGNHSMYVHVWNEDGTPRAGAPLYTSWGVFLGNTDVNGFVDVTLYRPNGYDVQIRDGSCLTDTSPIFNQERGPNWGHYSYEVGFVYKADSNNPGTFDINYDGILNAWGDQPCVYLSAPRTRSLAYYSTVPTDYCSDQYTLGNWRDSFGQTFVANGNRVVACKAALTIGGGGHFWWSAQILEGGPSGTPIGPVATSREVAGDEYAPIVVKWGINANPVTPGQTYCLKVWRSGGLNAWHVGNNYANGQFYENTTAVPSQDLMGFVVCCNTTSTTGAIAGNVKDSGGANLPGATITTNTGGYSATSDASGNYTMSGVATGTYDVTASKTGYTPQTQTGKVVTANQTTTANFTLACTAPSITTQPQSQTKCSGQSMTFTVVASGSGPLSYQWKKNGTNISGATSSSYTISTVTTGDAGSYTCYVSNACGNVTSNAATLTVNIPPSITTQPVSQTKNVGQSVTFTVAASGTTPLSYQWRKNGSNITGATSTSYSIASVQLTDAGNYDCVVTNSCGSVTSSTAVLTVSGGGTLVTENFEVVPSWSSSFDAAWGSAASWTSVAGGQSGSFLQVARSSQGSSVKTLVYTVPASTSITISAYMKCPSFGSSYWMEFAYRLGSYSAQDFDANPGSWTLVQKFSNSGYPNGNNNTWTQYPAAVSTGASTQIAIGYKLGSSGGAGPTVGWDTFRIDGPGCTAPAITTQPQSQTKCMGQSVTFTVAASGTTPLSYQWKKNGSNISGATSTSYTISSVTTGDAADYTCYVSNACGNVTSNAATLTVNTPPTITTQPQSQTKNVGESVTFTLAASGTTPLSYQWRKNGSNISGATSASYTIASVQLTDTGNYDCVVTNTCGSATSDVAVLTVTGGVIASEDFTTMPSWSSTYNASWGSAATWTIVAGGQSGNFLQCARSSEGSSARVKVYTVPTNTNIAISVYMKCPNYTTKPYWMESAFRLGNYTAQDFDQNGGAWTLIQKFSNSGYPNGNGNTWTNYTYNVNTGSNTQISIGYKLGSSGGAGPTVGWDTFRIQ